MIAYFVLVGSVCFLCGAFVGALAQDDDDGAKGVLYCVGAILCATIGLVCFR